MALCFLPAQHITPVFRRMEQEATAALTPLMQSVARTWIDSATWPPTCWSVYFQSVRTNNDLEGWHTRGHEPLHVGGITARRIVADSRRRLVSDGKLKRHQKKVFSDLQKNIFCLWEEYENGDRSAHHLL